MDKLLFANFSEEKKAKLKEKIVNKLDDAKEWVIRNKEALILLTPVAIKGVAMITKVIKTQRGLKKQEELKELYCYDRSLGHYWRLRRDLSNSEWLEIDSRKKNGERLSDILSELKVLK